jgi:hypothetical protein
MQSSTIFTSVLSRKVLFVLPVFVLFSVTVVSLPSNYIFMSTDSVDVSVLFGNWGVCACSDIMLVVPSNTNSTDNELNTTMNSKCFLIGQHGLIIDISFLIYRTALL